MEQLRAVKDGDEIEAIRRALHIAEAAFHKALEVIREGMTERELAHFLLNEMWRGGAVKESFDPLVLFGPRSSLCHGKPSDRPLENGDVALMDFGCLTPDGYNSDITRTVFFGRPSSELKEMYECVQAANQAAEDHLHANLSGAEGDQLAREVIRQAGREEQFMHGLGHGVGLEIHEAPRMSPLSESDLAAGNVITVEPGVYAAGTGGVRIEDMIILREDGCEVLNTSTKEMIVL
ncbi:MAG: M24 family metallopeptidase [Candidatus Hinthialibacter sp.]